MKRIYIFVLIIISQSNFLSGQKLIRMIVPPYPIKGESINLECQPDFPKGSNKQLKSVKWYKGNHEFYRYGTNHNKISPTFKMNGINVDASNSMNEVVSLKNISFATSGDYMCEVTLTDRSLQIAFGQLRVIAPPPNPPEITGVPSWVRVGDRIVGNCTSYHSKPAAQLKIYLNDQQIETPHITHFPTIMSRISDEMETSILGFHFEVTSENFIKNELNLKCHSFVLRNITGTTTKIVKDATEIANPPELLMPVYTENPVSIGDQIRGRCSFYYTEPPTSLLFYINGDQAFSQITANEAINLKTGVKMTFLNFDFDIIPNYFLKTKQINISCNATLRDEHFSRHVILNETPYVYQILKLMYGIKNSIVTLYNF